MTTNPKFSIGDKVWAYASLQPATIAEVTNRKSIKGHVVYVVEMLDENGFRDRHFCNESFISERK